MAKFLLRCVEDVDIFHAAAVIAGSVMKIALEMSLMIRAFGQTHASRYNNQCVVSGCCLYFRLCLSAISECDH